MILEFVNEALNGSSLPFMTLASTFSLMLTITGFRKKLKKQTLTAISSAIICFLVLLIPELFSKYALDLAHVSSHVMFNATLLLCAIILQYNFAEEFTYFSSSLYRSEEIGVFDRLQYHLAEGFISFSSRLYRFVEIGVFDRLQYRLAEEFTSFSNSLRKSHTGNLNLNMLALPFYFLLSLILLFL
jgi:hypothetical protein